MKKLLFILLAFIGASCVTQKACDKKFPPTSFTIVKDSIVVKDSIIYKPIEVPVYIKGDTVTKNDTVYLDGNTKLPTSKPVYAETVFAKAKAQVLFGKLNLELIQKDTGFKVEALAKEAYYWKELYNNSIKQVIVKEKYIPKFYSIMSWIGIITIVTILITLLYKFKKYINPTWPR